MKARTTRLVRKSTRRKIEKKKNGEGEAQRAVKEKGRDTPFEKKKKKTRRSAPQ